MPDFDPVAYAQERLAPSLGALCDLASHNGEAAQHLFFERILHGIENAAVPDDLAGPFMELSTSAFLGFRLVFALRAAFAQRVHFLNVETAVAVCVNCFEALHELLLQLLR